jgi:hypothetical protein
MRNPTINKDGSPRKKGSGRTKGSNSFEYISLDDLKSYINENARVPVSRVLLRNLGFSIKNKND